MSLNASIRNLTSTARPIVRDMLSSKLRALAAILLIALPVGLFAAEATFTNSVDKVSTNMEQSSRLYYSGGEVRDFDEQKREIDDLLPNGVEAIPTWTTSTTVRAADKGSSSGSVYTTPMTEDMFPRHYPERYREAINNGDVVLDTNAAKHLGVSEGDSVIVTIVGVQIKARVAALTPASSMQLSPRVIADAVAQTKEKDPDATVPAPSDWMLAGDHTFTPDDVQRAADAGYTLETPDTDFVANAPTSGAAGMNSEWFYIAFAVLAVAIAALLTVLFIGPVFTMAAGRHTRWLAIMAAQGATPAQLRRAVISYALTAGVIGSIIGTVLGTLGTWIYWLANFSHWPFNIPFGELAGIFAVGVIAAVIVAIGPAIITSRQAISAGLAGSSADRITHWRWWMGIGPVVLGLVIIVAAAIQFISPHLPKANLDGLPLATFILGNGLVQLTVLLICTAALAASMPAFTLLTGKLSAGGPLTVRAAGRAMRRSAFSSLPTMSALAAISLVLTAGVVTDDADQRVNADSEKLLTSQLMTWVSSGGDMYNSVDDKTASDKEIAEVDRALVDAVGSVTTTGQTYPIRGGFYPYNESYSVSSSSDASSDGTAGSTNANITLDREDTCTDNRTNYTSDSLKLNGLVGKNGKPAATDPDAARDCEQHMSLVTSYSPLGSQGFTYLVQQPDELDMWAIDDESLAFAQDTLQRGGILIADVGPRPDEAIKVTASDQKTPPNERSATLPVAPVLPKAAGELVVLSPQAAKKLELTPAPLGYAVQTPEITSEHVRNDISAAVNDAGREHADWLPSDPFLARFNTYLPDSHSMWSAAALTAIALVAMVMIIILAAAGIRRDATLWQAVGATPKTTAMLAAVQSFLTVGIGMGSGVLLGHIGAVLFATRDVHSAAGTVIDLGNMGSMNVNWWLVGSCVLVSLLAAVLSYGIHSRPRPIQLGRRSG